MNPEVRHKYDYGADCRAWERKHGLRCTVLNPTPLPGWMKHKGEQNDK